MYDGLSPSEALRLLNDRYIRKPECKSMLTKVAKYIEEIETAAVVDSMDRNLETLSTKFDDLSQNIISIEKQLHAIETA